MSACVLTGALALSGCAPAVNTAGGSGSSGGSNGGSSSGGGGPTQSYTADGLVAILKKVEASQHLTGTIDDNAQVKADTSELTKGSITSSLTADGGKIVPAECGTLLDNLVKQGAQAMIQNSWISATLEASTDIVGVGATTNASQAQDELGKIKDTMNQLSGKCSSMTIDAGAVKMSMSIKPMTFTTNASTTFGYEEDVAISGSKSVDKTLTIEAIYGNLFISDVGISNPQASDLEANVNAVIDAAKG